MHLASIENLAKSYGDNTLFEDITFHINQGDKIALIARNGQGKTSLLNILAGIDTQDTGTVWIHKDIQVVYLKQENDFNPDNTIEQQLFEMDHPTVKLLKDYEHTLENGQAETEHFQNLLSQMNEGDAWNFEGSYKEIVGKLKLPNLNTKVATLSGGQKKRLALAQSLLETQLYEGASLFILDEPTNHLDIEMIEWLEQKLTTQKSTLLLVSHDRYFIDAVCNTLIEIEDNKAHKHTGDYQTYLENKAHRIEVAASEQAKDKNIYRRELEWMRRQPQGRATKAKARQDSFYDIEDKVKKNKADSTLTLEVKMNRLGGKILEMKKVYKSYGDLVLLKGFDYTFQKGERIGIVGKNGVGKSTLLKIALGKEEADSGKINHGETVVFGHFDQKGLQWEKEMRLIEFVKAKAEYFPLADGTKISASAFLERFAFPPEKQHTFLSKLSGGEKRRLQLLSILFKNPNFLVLDEPTNDLDLQTLGLLEDFLMNYPGCLILVSHDRYFMDKLVQHLFVFEGDGEINVFPGNYRAYRLAKSEGRFEKNKQQVVSSDDSTKSQAERVEAPKKEKRQLSYKEKTEFAEIEKALPILEAEKEELTTKLSESSSDFEAIENISKRLSEITEELEIKEMRWLEISEILG